MPPETPKFQTKNLSIGTPGRARMLSLMDIKYLGNNMNTEHNFLVRYGLHNFVTCTQTNGKNTFFIKCLANQNMIYHAEYLIKEAFGETMDIKLI